MNIGASGIAIMLGTAGGYLGGLQFSLGLLGAGSALVVSCLAILGWTSRS